MFTADEIAFLALIVSLFSLLISARGIYISKRSLKISEDEHSSKELGLEPYLIEGVNYIVDGVGQIIAFNISVTNLSSVQNAIKRLDLLVSTARSDNSQGNFVLQHDANLTKYIKLGNHTPFGDTCELPSKSAKSNWCFFLYDPILLNNCRVEKYSIRVFDAHDRISVVDSYLLKELRIEK